VTISRVRFGYAKCPTNPWFVMKSRKNFKVFTVYRVHGVVIGGKFSPIREYSNTVNNRRNCFKGLKYIWKNRDQKFMQSINSGIEGTPF
jgi:hypothetical protein